MSNNETKPRRHCRFIAFYSYKGGVGRTLALANAARRLAAKGKRVVVMDFDLEAPGLDHFQAFWPKKAKSRAKEQESRPRLMGFAEYIQACRRSEPPVSLKPYIHPCRGEKEDKGQVWMMPAGLYGEEAYQEILNLHWERFYGEEEGYRIMENLRGHIIDEFNPDYVLMDARTGLSEMGGIATHQLADLVVLLFNLNQQNLEGTKRVYDSLLRLPSPPLILLAASPIPAVPTGKGTPFHDKMQWIYENFRRAENATQQKLIVIPYQPVLAFEERILVDQHDDPFDSGEAYRRLMIAIQDAVKVDPDIFLDRAMQLWRAGNMSEAAEVLAKALREISDDPALLARQGSLLIAQNRTSEALPLLEKAVVLKPRDATVWFNLAVARGISGNASGAVEAGQRTVALDQNNASAWNNLGIALDAAGDRPGAIEAYRRAVAIKPDKHEAWNNLGIALDAAGDRTGAIEAYRQAIAIKSDHFEAWAGLGATLAKQGKFSEAIESCQRAGDVGLYNLTCAYALQGLKKEGLAQLRLAIAKNPKLAEHAKQDKDWKRYWDDKEFLRIVGGKRKSTAAS